MRKDPIVEEIHQIREAHAKRFHYDLHAIFSDMRKREAKRADVVDLQHVKPALSCVAEKRATYRTNQEEAR